MKILLILFILMLFVGTVGAIKMREVFNNKGEISAVIDPITYTCRLPNQCEIIENKYLPMSCSIGKPIQSLVSGGVLTDTGKVITKKQADKLF